MFIVVQVLFWLVFHESRNMPRRPIHFGLLSLRSFSLKILGGTMKAFLSFVFAFALTSSTFGADDSKDWDPKTRLPEWTFVGKVSEREKALAQTMREKMIGELQFWKDHGLESPPVINDLIYIPTYEGMGVADFFKLLHNKRGDIIDYILAQYDYYTRSSVYVKLKYMGEKLGAKSDQKVAILNMKAQEILNRLFDRYVMLRYGFSAEDIIPHLLENTPMEVLAQKPIIPMKDNAFYGRVLPIEIQDLVKPMTEAEMEAFKAKVAAADTNIVSKAKLYSEILGSVFAEMNGKNILNLLKIRKPTRRIVILPRTTQGRDDVEVSTLCDPSVVMHEKAHNINSLLTGNGHMASCVDEALADFLAALPEENPRIGEFFVKASGVIASRLADSRDPDEVDFAEKMAMLAKKKFLRDLSEPYDIDDLERENLLANEHEAGNPLRKVLWSLSSNPTIRPELNSILFKVVSEFTSLPAVVTSRTQAALLFRQIRTQGKLRSEQEKVAKRLAAEAPQMSKREIELAAAKIAKLNMKEKEAQAIVNRHTTRWYATSDREAIEADYALPEFFRVLYRHALKVSPHFALQVQQEAEVAMNSKAVVIKAESGKEYLVFLKNARSLFDKLMTPRLQEIIDTLDATRTELATLADKPDAKKDRTIALALYERSIESLLEYERTGKFFALYAPHPIVGPTEKLLSFLAKPHMKKCDDSLR